MSEPQTWAAIAVLASALLGGGWLARLAFARAWVRDFLARAQEEIRVAVLEVEQTYVDVIMAARDPGSPGGAELMPGERDEALRRAVKRARELIGLDALDRALRILRLPTTPAFVDAWITARVEAHVNTMRRP